MAHITNEEKIRALVGRLNLASEAYYNESAPIMTDQEWDAMYNQLVLLEHITGITLPNSPTQKVGAAVPVNSPLAKVKHEYPALSLDKTKDVELLLKKFREGEAETEFAGTTLMWKCDGCTAVATYENGNLVQLVTRGDGEIGEDVTHNAPFIKGLPQKISYQKKMVVRGEAMISYAELDRINALLPIEEQYANPRNLVSSTIRLTPDGENARMRGREVVFHAFNLVTGTDIEMFDEQLEYLATLGFKVVPFESVTAENDDLKNSIEEWSKPETAEAFGYPVDGLVVCLNDLAYTKTLPGTNHNPHILAGYALKWADETKETVLRKIEWSVGRTGQLTPVAVFDPVELEGTTVTRASLHNVTYVLDRNLVEGDSITVFKANQIIPQVDKNLSYSKHPLISSLSPVCPCCNTKAEFTQLENQRSVAAYCPNEKCAAKRIGAFKHFVERDCMNIVGLSEATLTTFAEHGFIKEFADLWKLAAHKEEIVELEGFGEQSYQNITSAVAKAGKEATFVGFLHALGIDHVGKGQAKLMQPYVNDYAVKNESFDLVGALSEMIVNNYDFSQIDGIGTVINDSIYASQFAKDVKSKDFDTETFRLLDCLEFVPEIVKPKVLAEGEELSKVNGKTFVITGALTSGRWENRDAAIREIESLGGKVSGSVSKKTDYLVTNDTNSGTGKNKKAAELGVPVITELQLIEML